MLTNYAEGITERERDRKSAAGVGATPRGVRCEFICTDEPETVLPAGNVRNEYIKHSIEKRV